MVRFPETAAEAEKLVLSWTANSSRNAARRAKAAGDWELAARHYARAVQRGPRSAATWVQFGNALREAGEAARAEAAYRKSLELRDGDPDAHVQLAHLLKYQRRGDEAIAEYLRALDLDPWLVHVSQELIDLGWTGHVKPPRHYPVGRRPKAASAAQTRTPRATVVDASDLLLHFLHARLPTGIQRVQLHIIVSLLAAPVGDCTPLLACFAPSRDFWVRIPEDLFASLAGLATSGGANDERRWQEAVFELTSVLVHGDLIEFPAGAVLVNLGASWRHLNYFLKLRNAKAGAGITYIPFVHDCIPVLLPEHCVEATVRTYIDWLLGVFFHADGYLVNSQSTGLDLTRAAAVLGHRISPPQVVPLDGAFSTEEKTGAVSRNWQHHRSVEPFVLFVSTFEPRKNHLLAFTLWLKLIEKRGLRGTPSLVCVGHRGWKIEPALSLLRESKPLQRRVKILTGIADTALAELYQRCLFTFYPSAYEGWGLPVTESLCYGKVPLISATSSLPEAGGGFAEYFDLQSPGDALAKLEQLIDDQNYRASREALIKEKFRPRSWRAIAEQVIDYALSTQSRTTAAACGRPSGEVDEIWAPPAEMGRYYAMARGRETSIRSGMAAGEMFRTGEGWWPPEEWGCWLKDAHAELAFSLPGLGDRGCLLYLQIRGLPICRTDFEVSIGADEVLESGTLEPGECRWLALRIKPDAERGSMARLRLASSGSCDLAAISGGIDRRIVTLGAVGLCVCSETGAAPDFVRNNAGLPLLGCTF
jgi:glycosyltransferase involved in cell wall biosynthesis